MKTPLLEVNNLRVYFNAGGRPARAVDGVSISISRGETAALVGESGCGKSVTALALARLAPSPPAVIAGGSIRFESRDVLLMSDAELRRLRGARIAYVFQEPGVSLNPVFRVGWQIAEALHLHRPGTPVRDEVIRLLRLVGLPDPERARQAYPHELSGGMQQRVMIAMALACRPSLLVADEPTTALDVTIQAQIMELLVSLQNELGMAMLLITHNLGLVAGAARRVYVMYAGRIVESGPTEQVLAHPRHPYTQGLLEAVPRLEGAAAGLKGIEGSVPDASRLPPGCRFHPRCMQCRDICRAQEPELAETGQGQSARCWLAEKG
ncbi:MAG: ABC transporter ATP-binding protein [Verrucomicrobia bacterium]|nr:ABC transporter ATP-binding protein [Verrucomicrobiota bacterium]MBU4289666.1 ABC transporter ATP-binding protein [Verrucomicrobiota bacterium]MBU4496945.1 ABC transporter ATP-binding protein [Verrucomicrobiota bacterium]MCG2680334.1 ABC transporter ATP-binding protein [Kiritimatiellia bacterium]